MTSGPTESTAEPPGRHDTREASASTFPIQFEGRTPFEAYRQAQWQHLLRFFRRVLVLWVIMGFVFLANLFMTPPEDPATMAIALVILVVVVLGIWAFSEASIRRTWRNHETLKEPIQGSLFDDHFEAKTRFGSCALPWSHFHDWRSSADLLLLYQSDNCLYILSRNLFGSDDDWQRARDLVARKIDPGLRRRSRGRLGKRTRPDDQG